MTESQSITSANVRLMAVVVAASPNGSLRTICTPTRSPRLIITTIATTNAMITPATSVSKRVSRMGCCKENAFRVIDGDDRAYSRMPLWIQVWMFWLWDNFNAGRLNDRSCFAIDCPGRKLAAHAHPRILRQILRPHDWQANRHRIGYAAAN